MAKKFPTVMPGCLLASTSTPVLGERHHLCRLDDGTFALVESWPSIGECSHPVRRYAIWNLIGSHISLDAALARFQEWN